MAGEITVPVLRGIDVEEGIGCVGEVDIDGVVFGIPPIDLAFTGLQEGFQAGLQVSGDEGVDRLHALTVVGYGDVGIGGLLRVAQAFDQVIRQAGAVAGQSDNEIGVNLLHDGEEASEGALEVAERVTDYRMAEAGILFQVAVGVDHHLVHLRLNALQHMGDQGSAVQINQALVLSTHASCHTACENNGGDFWGSVVVHLVFDCLIVRGG